MMNDRSPYFGHDHLGGSGHPWLHALCFVLFLLAFGGVIFAAVRFALGRPLHLRGSAATAVEPGTDEALATLRMRYARGEVSRDDFLAAHVDLGGSAPPEPDSVPPPS
ncbi:MAG: hypothetical protein WCH31_08435 [Actinomycetes bacterium]